MSSEELTSIEKNGNYWLSKSNTAYHIVNPNASDSEPYRRNWVLSASPRVATNIIFLDANGNSISDLMGLSMHLDIRLRTPTLHVEESFTNEG